MEILRREYSVNIRIISISRKTAFLMKDILNRDLFSDHADRVVGARGHSWDDRGSRLDRSPRATKLIGGGKRRNVSREGRSRSR